MNDRAIELLLIEGARATEDVAPVSEPETEPVRWEQPSVGDQLRAIELKRMFYGDSEALQRQERHLRGSD